MINNPSYYTVIPSNVRYDRNLTYFEIVLYGEIVSLTNSTGYCFATNAYFQKLFDVSESTIKRSIKKLGLLGHLKIEINQNETQQRKIFIGFDPGFKNDSPRGSILTPPPGFKNDTHNNTSINTKFNSNYKPGKKFLKNQNKPDVSIDWLDDYINELNHE